MVFLRTRKLLHFHKIWKSKSLNEYFLLSLAFLPPKKNKILLHPRNTLLPHMHQNIFSNCKLFLKKNKNDSNQSRLVQ